MDFNPDNREHDRYNTPLSTPFLLKSWKIYIFFHFTSIDSYPLQISAE